MSACKKHFILSGVLLCFTALCVYSGMGKAAVDRALFLVEAPVGVDSEIEVWDKFRVGGV